MYISGIVKYPKLRLVVLEPEGFSERVMAVPDTAKTLAPGWILDPETYCPTAIVGLDAPKVIMLEVEDNVADIPAA